MTPSTYFLDWPSAKPKSYRMSTSMAASLTFFLRSNVSRLNYERIFWVTTSKTAFEKILPKTQIKTPIEVVISSMHLLLLS